MGKQAMGNIAYNQAWNLIISLLFANTTFVLKRCSQMNATKGGLIVTVTCIQIIQRQISVFLDAGFDICDAMIFLFCFLFLSFLI